MILARFSYLLTWLKKNIDTINSKFTNTITNEKKKKVWENITSQINALGISNRSIKEIKTKWTNMHQTAKKKSSVATNSPRERRVVALAPNHYR